MLREIVARGTPAQRDWAVRTYRTSEQFRGQRQAFVGAPELAAPIAAAGAGKERIVYDAQFGSTLPGRRARGEGDPPTGDKAVDEAYDGSGATYDIYQTVYGRNSIDGNNLRLDSTVHYQKGYDNAFWNGQQMVYGDGDEDQPEPERLFNRFTIAIDIIGHELTHGVTQYEAKLVYRNQPGALNESFSDVFGSLVKQRTLNQTADQADWIIGQGLFTANVKGVGIRSMKAPGTAYDDPVLGKDPQPAHMRDYNNTTADNGGVHINSGIPNYAFYVAAKELAGEIKWFPEGLGRIEARLAHFSIPEATPGKKEEAPSRDLPALDIVADKLFLNGNDLGRLELQAVNKALDWTIEKLVLTGPESTLRAEGRWESWALRPSVKIDKIDLRVGDAGKYLERVGYPGTMRQGTATLKGNLSWAGSPQSLDFATLSGELVLEAQKGQFQKAEAAVARLLGVLSMQSWITVDFRELFRRGFAFDTISSKATVTNGVLKTDDFHMQGPSADVRMRGEVDLNRETQDLHAKVEPSVGNSLASILVLAVNPAWGLGAFIIDKILKNPLGQALAFEYRVTGTWAHPEAKPLKADVRTPDATQEPPP